MRFHGSLFGLCSYLLLLIYFAFKKQCRFWIYHANVTPFVSQNLRLGFVKNSIIKNLTSINSKYFHIAILGSDNTTLEHVTIDAPGDSVNTDGVHIAKLNCLTIKDFNIKTGDDFISFGDGCKNIHVEKVACGPGHGISVGSMGKYQNEESV